LADEKVKQGDLKDKLIQEKRCYVSSQWPEALSDCKTEVEEEN
jgi:hypothetical protein